MRNILKILPKNYLSYGFGKIANIPLPRPLNKALIQWFADTYKINLNEIEHDLESYRSLGDFFTRTLKPGARPIGEGLVHPCDSSITEFGQISKQTLVQAKGMTYSLTELLGSHDLASDLEGGIYITYYLCPSDYHRVHAPADLTIHSCMHIPGQLWPVNSWSVKTIPNLFPRNERLVTRLQIQKLPAALVMVGATNVGKITLSFDQGLVTNNLSSKTVNREYKTPVLLKKGSQFGTFHMGSTVVMIYGPDIIKNIAVLKRGPVLMGESIGEV